MHPPPTTPPPSIMHRLLDHGGRLLFWDAGSSPRTGLRIHTKFCKNPECLWAHLDVTPLQGTNGDDEAGSTIRVSVHVDSGDTRLGKATERGASSTEVMDRLDTLLDQDRGEIKNVLRRRWRHAKDPEQDGWRVHDWSWWEPGQLVSWSEVYPDAPDFMFTSDGQEYLADDLYCIAADCRCREVKLAFSRLEQDPLEPLCAITVDPDGWAIHGAESGQGATAQEQQLWKDLQRATPRLRKGLLQRLTKLQQIAPEIRAGASRAQLPVELARSGPGRNAPCPCGSGRKYKKCCL